MPITPHVPPPHGFFIADVAATPQIVHAVAALQSASSSAGRHAPCPAPPSLPLLVALAEGLAAEAVSSETKVALSCIVATLLSHRELAALVLHNGASGEHKGTQGGVLGARGRWRSCKYPGGQSDDPSRCL